MWVGLILFFKQKTAYEMPISDWSSDVCSSDLGIATVNASGDVQEFSKGDGYLASSSGVAGTFTPPAPNSPQYGSNGSSRSEESRVGKVCVSTCRIRRSPSP